MMTERRAEIERDPVLWLLTELGKVETQFKTIGAALHRYGPSFTKNEWELIGRKLLLLALMIRQHER
jgi:hypothetical protein